MPTLQAQQNSFRNQGRRRITTPVKMKNILQWPSRASKDRHHILGLRLRWTEKSQRYQIEKFPNDGDPICIVMVRDDDDEFPTASPWRPIAQRRGLTAAKKYCEKHFKQKERKAHVRQA